MLGIERGEGLLSGISTVTGNRENAHKERMAARKPKPGTYCVFNPTRDSFLSLNVTVADTHFARLKGMLGRIRLKADEGIWVVPSQGVHSMGVLFSVDLIYLDADNRVIHLVESFGTFRIGPVRRQASSVLELPTRTIYSSQTQIGDQLLIASGEDMEEFLRKRQTDSAASA